MMPPLARRTPACASRTSTEPKAPDAMIASLLHRVSSLLVAASLAASLPILAAPATAQAAGPTLGPTVGSGFSAGPVLWAAPAKKPAAEPATDGRTIGVMRFSGAEAAAELRASLQPSLEEAGYTVRGIALELPDAAKSVKCKGEPDGDECLAAIGKWLNAKPKTAADFI